MKIKVLTLLSLLFSISFTTSIKIKTDNTNNIKFTASNVNSENQQETKLMENLIISKSIGVSSRIV